MKKKALTIIIGISLIFGFALGAGAAPALQSITAHLNWSIKFNIEGASWSPKDENGNKLAPIIYNNSTYLPVRAVSEALGTSVNWDQKSQTIHLGESTSEVSITSLEKELHSRVFQTSDKKYTVQNGKDYGSGFVLKDLNSVDTSLDLVPNGKYQTLNLTFVNLDDKKDIYIQVKSGEDVLEDLTLSPGQPLGNVDLNVGGQKTITISATSTMLGEETLFVAGYFK